MSSLFNRLGNNNQLPNMADLQKYAGQLQGDPAGFLGNLGLNLPGNVDVRNPNAIINYLMQSGQVNAGLLGKAQALMSLIKR